MKSRIVEHPDIVGPGPQEPPPDFAITMVANYLRNEDVGRAQLERSAEA